DMHSPKQEIRLLGLVIKRPAAIEKVALVSRIRDGDCKTRSRQVRKGLEVRKDLRKVEIAAKATVADEEQASVSGVRQAEAEVHLIGSRMLGSDIPHHRTVRDRVGLRHSRYDCRVRRRNGLNGGWAALESGLRGARPPQPKAQEQHAGCLNSIFHLTVHIQS